MTSKVNAQELAELREKLATSKQYVERALVVLYERQTADEQASQETNHRNGMGFNGTDARILSSFAEQILSKHGKHNSYLNRPNRYGDCLSPKQFDIAKGKVAKYALQIMDAAKAKAEGKAQVEAQVSGKPVAAPAPAAVPFTEAEAQTVARMVTGYAQRGEKNNIAYWMEYAAQREEGKIAQIDPIVAVRMPAAPLTPAYYGEPGLAETKANLAKWTASTEDAELDIWAQAPSVAAEMEIK